MSSAAEPTTPLVALVCSAAGLVAMTQVLGRLAPGFPGAIVALDHQQPDRPSRLAAILATRCRLPVREARYGDRLVAGEVLVVPPGVHAVATRTDTIVLLSTGGTPPGRPSADLLLATLAVTGGTRVIAVILSGTGPDGAAGALAVHDFGGTVIVDDEPAAEPFATAAATIDRDDAANTALPVRTIANRLMELCARPMVTTPTGRPASSEPQRFTWEPS
jgi:two-component system chemotaxis response regulator CheB